MSRVLFDFQCSNGHIMERLVKPTARTVKCRLCGQTATRMLAAPRANLEGISGSFPTAADKWEKRRISHMAKESRNMERHGTYK